MSGNQRALAATKMNRRTARSRRALSNFGTHVEKWAIVCARDDTRVAAICASDRRRGGNGGMKAENAQRVGGLRERESGRDGAAEKRCNPTGQN